MKKLTSCNQQKCAYLQMGMGCKPCKICKAESYIINENCDCCWNCSKDEGILRWDDDNNKPQDIKDKNKPIEIDIKTQ